MKQKAVGVGVVIRDSEGRLEAALGAAEVEAKAFEVGLLFAKEVGVRDVVLEGDSINVLMPFVTTPRPHLQLLL